MQVLKDINLVYIHAPTHQCTVCSNPHCKSGLLAKCTDFLLLLWTYQTKVIEI